MENARRLLQMITSGGHKDYKAICHGNVLRVLICGDVDAGKSTLVSRLLFDLDLVPDDQLRSLQATPNRTGFALGDINVSLPTDGLKAEQQQGRTTDIDYCYVQASRRKLIIADVPEHEQYMLTTAREASSTDVAIILVDACKGILTQAHRHALIASLFGVRHAILAINKMDAANYSQMVFQTSVQRFLDACEWIQFVSITAIPIVAQQGNNIVSRTQRMPWYDGPTLVEYLDTIDISSERQARALRLPVQAVSRADDGTRTIAGTIASGVLRVGDTIGFIGTNMVSRVSRLLAGGGDCLEAIAGESVAVMLTDDVDIGRADMVHAPDEPPDFADQFSGHLLWVGDEHLVPKRSYLLKMGTRTVRATVTKIKYQIDMETGAHLAQGILEQNQIAMCNFSTSMPISIDSFRAHPEVACFILIDRITHATVGTGAISFALRRATNIHPYQFEIDRQARAVVKGQQPVVLWLTGLPGSGKSTLANLVERKLYALGRHTYLIDGDNIRHGLNRDLGFTEADRAENIRRVAEVTKLFVDAGLIVIVALVSPYRVDRLQARESMKTGEFIEIFVDTPLDVCRERDPKGLYAKALRGELRNMTGVDQPYEAPEQAEIRLSTINGTADQLSDQVIEFLRSRWFIS